MVEQEKNTWGKRMRRYANVSGAAANLGARVAMSRLTNGSVSDETRNSERAKLLGAALGSLKGPLMKVAQLLAAIPDLLPPEYTAELAKLQADAPPMGWPFVRRRMATELGADWQTRFRDFEHEAARAASLGQVHRATGHDGRSLACKLQYPDMTSVIEADLQQLSIVLKVFERIDPGVNTAEVQREIAERLREELDYIREGRHMRLYRRMLADVNVAHVPEIIDDLSTPRLITMTWLDGERIETIAEHGSLATRNTVAVNMFRTWYTPLYTYGVIHGDPHPGNYTICSDHSVNLLDFGCVRIFPPRLVQGVMLLYRALMNNDDDMAAEAYREWGFINPSKGLIEALNIWARFLYAPILDDRCRKVEETNTGIIGRKTARRVHDELQLMGRVTVPREFVFMDRAAVGLGAVFLRLRAEINWYRLFHETVGDFNVDVLATRQSNALKECGLN